MHTRSHSLLAASLLAIMSISPVLMANRVNLSDEQSRDADQNGKQQVTSHLRHMGDHDQNQPSQDFVESRSSAPSIQEYPRQLFRLHILDSRPRIMQKNRNNYHQLNNSTDKQHANKQSGYNKPNKNISNATLKKLLSQAMQQQQNRLAILARNLTGSPATSTTTSRPIDLSSEIKSEQANFIIAGNSQTSTTTKLRPDDTNVIYKPGFVTRSPVKPGSGNFKFVFIQRAAANANSTSAASAPSSKHKQSESSVVASTPATATTPSLAASISRQLANSLLYSAANFVSNLNLTSSNPSLSDLKNQLTTKKDNDDEDNKETTSNDIQRLTTKLDDRSDLQKAVSTTKRPQITSPSSSSQRPKYRKNSKIYNLPVKFVANGQPNGQIVIQTIKQHLAAMKRTSSVAGLLATAMPDYGIVKHANNQNNFNRDQPSTNIRNQKIKLKGVNSRLIYLPLRMLMNGKASRISVVAGKTSRGEAKSTTKSKSKSTTSTPTSTSSSSIDEP